MIEATAAVPVRLRHESRGEFYTALKFIPLAKVTNASFTILDIERALILTSVLFKFVISLQS